MQISTFNPAGFSSINRSLPKSEKAPAQEVPAEKEDGFVSSETINNLKIGGVAAACGAVGYGGSMAHSIPYAGPVISGVIGAVVGASAGASLAAALPGEKIKTGALLGLVGGAILGASGGGSTAASVAMGVAGATVPFGLLMAVFS